MFLLFDVLLGQQISMGIARMFDLCAKDVDVRHEHFWTVLSKQTGLKLEGFGNEFQMYLKRGITLTPWHTELLWSSALNLMRHDSDGAAIWIGFWYEDLYQKYKPKELEMMIVCALLSV